MFVALIRNSCRSVFEKIRVWNFLRGLLSKGSDCSIIRARMVRSRGLLFLIAVACLTQVAFAKSDVDWQVIKVGNRDYLSVDNIAKFYGC